MEDKLVIDLLHYPYPTTTPGSGPPNTQPLVAQIKGDKDSLSNCISAKIVGYAIQSAYGNEQGALNIPPRDPYVIVNIGLNTRAQVTVAGANPLAYTGVPAPPLTGATIPPGTGYCYERSNGFPLLMPALDSISVPNLNPPIDITNFCKDDAKSTFDLSEINVTVSRPPPALRYVNKNGSINTVQSDAVLVDRITLILSVTRLANTAQGMPTYRSDLLPNPALLNDRDGRNYTDQMREANFRDANFHVFGKAPFLK